MALAPRPAGPYLVGVDAGHTVIKAAVFDRSGTELARAARPTATFSRQPQWQERDMDVVWASAAGAISDALAHLGVSGEEVAGVGVVAHGDGLYLVDERLEPVRPAILATDTRAIEYSGPWAAGADANWLTTVSGQVPAPYTAPATLSWLRDHEPEILARSAHLLFCKDWLRLKLTGRVAIDPADAATGLYDVRRREWSDELLEFYGLAGVRRLLPDVLPSAEVAGMVTELAAAATGLRPGTPVVTGTHDVQAAALGIGALLPGSRSALLGTFNINALVTEGPSAGARWQSRCSPAGNRFLAMSTSPAGATAMDWLRDQLAGQEDVGAAVAAALEPGVHPDDPMFLPFVYGTQLTPPLGGALVGLRGWHGPADLLRAALEGVVFTHRNHLEALATAGPVADRPLRLAGGGARSSLWSQLFADVTGDAVEVTDATEAGARGAAMLAGVGAGLYSDVDSAARECVRVVRTHRPDSNHQQILDGRYHRWSMTIRALQTVAT